MVKSILDVANGKGNSATSGFVTVSDDLGPAETLGRKKRDTRRSSKPSIRLPGVKDEVDTLLALLYTTKTPTNSAGSKHTTARPILCNRLMKPT